MGKKSKESSGDTAVAVGALFSADNPFRRKPQTDAASAFSGDAPQPSKKLGFELVSSSRKRKILTEDKISDDVAAKVRKRKRDGVMEAATPGPLSADENPIPVKRNRLVVEEKWEESNNQKKKKRKREEVFLEQENRNQLLEGNEAALAVSTDVAVVKKRKAADVVATDVAAGKKRKAAAVAATDVLHTNESFDDESKLLRTVFIGNLPLKMKRKALNREFARFGEIESVRIRSVALVDTKAPRKAAIIMGKINKKTDSVNAYIVFKDEQSAQDALSQNMAQVGGNHIRVDTACPPRKKMKGDFLVYDRKKTAFVGNLPFDVKDEELYQLFCGLNPSEPNVEAVRVIRDPNLNVGKGIAFVQFKTRDAANEVCKRRDLKIRDRDLRICHVKSDAIPSSKVKEGPSSSSAHRSPATGSGIPPPGKGEKRRREAAASVSYEGTRSSKSGAVKKTSRHLPTVGSRDESSKSSWNGLKAGSKKRPAVAARKAKQLRKRKQADGTPENAHRNKRVRRQ